MGLESTFAVHVYIYILIFIYLFLYVKYMLVFCGKDGSVMNFPTFTDMTSKKKLNATCFEICLVVILGSLSVVLVTSPLTPQRKITGCILGGAW